MGAGALVVLTLAGMPGAASASENGPPQGKHYQEAPMLAARVAQGDLPPVDERLPEDPAVVEPVECIG